MRYLKEKTALRDEYWDLYNTLNLAQEDNYYVMLDLEAYINTTLRANADYAEEQRTGDLSRHTRKALKNTAKSGIFSSDRTIQEYSDEIWHLEPVEQ